MLDSWKRVLTNAQRLWIAEFLRYALPLPQHRATSTDLIPIDHSSCSWHKSSCNPPPLASPLRRQERTLCLRSLEVSSWTSLWCIPLCHRCFNHVQRCLAAHCPDPRNEKPGWTPHHLKSWNDGTRSVCDLEQKESTDIFLGETWSSEFMNWKSCCSSGGHHYRHIASKGVDKVNSILETGKRRIDHQYPLCTSPGMHTL